MSNDLIRQNINPTPSNQVVNNQSNQPNYHIKLHNKLIIPLLCYVYPFHYLTIPLRYKMW